MATFKNFFISAVKLSAIILSCFLPTLLCAQKDSLILKNGNVIVGEIKSLDKGVITIGTAYGVSDFSISWAGIKEIYSVTPLQITLKNGERINGTFHSADGGSKMIITDNEGKQTETVPEDVVLLKGLQSNFWSRAHASVALGLSVARANNLVQYNMRSSVGYVADKWLTEIYYDDLRSKQDSVAETRRTASGASYSYVLSKDWYVTGGVTTLSSTEQALKMRFAAKTGVGKYIVNTTECYFGAGAGVSVNDETFTNGTPGRTSLEGYFGADVNLFSISKFGLLSSLYVYPSFTESGRWRTDFKLDTKYELPLDLFLKFGITINYDNRPAQAGQETDYVYVFSVGWSL